MNSVEKAKEAAGIAAADLIHDGMTIGLGTGSTAAYFIAHLGKRCRQGLKIKAAASSEKTCKLATAQEIPLIDANTIVSLDIAIDGADEIDPEYRLIKGGGGAAFREKIIAEMSKEFIVIADSGKKVEWLGKAPLPVEILPFGWSATINQLQHCGYGGRLRTSGNDSLFVTDNGHYIYDAVLPYPCSSPEQDHRIIKSITGVLETGFFIGIASKIVIGFPDGHVEMIKAKKQNETNSRH